MRKQTKTNKSLVLALLTGAVAVGFTGGATRLAAASVAPTMSFNKALETTYDFGAELTLPEGWVTLDGQKYAADCVLYRPDGTATNGASVALNVTGEYLLEYIAKVNGRYVTEKQTFVVTNESLSVSGKGNVTYTEFNGIRGAKVQMQDGDVLSYNQVIYLNRFSDTDELFRLFALPQVAGQEEFGRFEVTIQDIHDADKKIVVEVKQSPSTGNKKIVGYANAKYGDGVFVGLHPAAKNAKGAIEFEGAQYDFARASFYGAPIEECSFAGTPAKTTLGKEWIGICYGAESNIVRAKNQTKVLPIADMDSPAFFKETFQGFTTGEVRISIKPTNYVRSTATLFVTHFAGKPIAENAYYADDKAPELTVDLGGYSETALPNAVVGKAYKLFGASAMDINDGAVNTECNVYYGYNNERPINVNVKGGAFVPTREGVYTIEYKATDKAGNVALKKLRVYACQRGGAFSLSLTGFVNELTAGRKQSVIDGYGVENAFGDTELYAVATLRDNPAVQYVLDEDYAFTPLYSGTYDVTFRYSDYHETQFEQKTLIVTASDETLFEADGVFPKYLLKNGVYEFPTVQAIVLSSGVPVYSQTQLYVINDNGAEVPFSAYPKVTATGEVTLRYRHADGAYYDVEFPVIDAGFATMTYRIKDYFTSTNGAVVSTADNAGVYLTVTSAQDGAAAQFVNPLSPSTFQLNMQPLVGGEWKAGAKFALYLQDVTNTDNVLKFAYVLKAHGVYVSVNDGKEYFLCDTFAAEDDVLKLTYSVQNGKASFNDALTVAVATNLQGNLFTGFGKSVMLTIAFEEGFVVGDGVTLTNLNGQTLSNTKRDQIGAALVHANSSYGEKSLNDVVEILPCYAYDVLTPDVVAYVSVKAPNGQYVQDLDGVLLNGKGEARAGVLRKVQLTQYGTYEFVITAQDTAGNPARFPFTAYVYPNELPKIEISKETVKGSVNKAVSLNNYTISGVSDLSKCTVFTTVMKPNGTVEYLGKATSYLAKEKGTYIVRIMVMDEYGNLGEATFTLMIS